LWHFTLRFGDRQNSPLGAEPEKIEVTLSIAALFAQSNLVAIAT
jgi:hypothetical protein